MVSTEKAVANIECEEARSAVGKCYVAWIASCPVCRLETLSRAKMSQVCRRCRSADNKGNETASIGLSALGKLTAHVAKEKAFGT